MEGDRPLSSPRGPLLGSALAFVAGALLYVTRASSPGVVTLLGGDAAWARLTGPLGAVRAAAPAAVLHQGSDALFAASVALFLAALWGPRRGPLAFGLAFVLALEVLQAFDAVPGTFDAWDCVAETVAYGAALGIAFRPRGARGRAPVREMSVRVAR